jgi:hypothetical protein
MSNPNQIVDEQLVLASEQFDRLLDIINPMGNCDSLQPDVIVAMDAFDGALGAIRRALGWAK